MKHTIDPSNTLTRIVEARALSKDERLSPQERLDAARRWSRLENRLKLEQTLLRTKRFFWWMTRIVCFPSALIGALCLIGFFISGSTDFGWGALASAVLFCGAICTSSVANRRIRALSEYIDSTYPV